MNQFRVDSTNRPRIDFARSSGSFIANQTFQTSLSVRFEIRETRANLRIMSRAGVDMAVSGLSANAQK